MQFSLELHVYCKKSHLDATLYPLQYKVMQPLAVQLSEL